MNVLLGIFDLIPVVLCFIALWLLQTSLYSKMNKYSYALVAAGSIMILFAGLFKALWKILLYTVKIDFYRWDYMFFPVQAIGFLIVTAGLLIFILENKGVTKLNSIILLPLLFFILSIDRNYDATLANDTIIYVVLQVLGSLGVTGSILIMSLKNGYKLNILFTLLSFFFMLTMGYMSVPIGRAIQGSSEWITLNWVAEAINILGQALLLVSVLKYRKTLK